MKVFKIIRTPVIETVNVLVEFSFVTKYYTEGKSLAISYYRVSHIGDLLSIRFFFISRCANMSVRG